MSVKTIRGNLLFWKISAVFASLLLVLALVFVLIGSRFSKTYYMAAHQQLYGDIPVTWPPLPSQSKMVALIRQLRTTLSIPRWSPTRAWKCICLIHSEILPIM